MAGIEIIVGKKVTWAGLFPTSPVLMVHFDGLLFAKFEYIKTGNDEGIRIDIGYLEESAFLGIKEIAKKTLHTEALVGKKFTEVTNDVISFGMYGVKVDRFGLRFVKKAM